jgi:hypothetical protein
MAAVMTITIYQCRYEILSINVSTTCTPTKLPPTMTNDSGKQSPKLTLGTHNYRNPMEKQSCSFCAFLPGIEVIEP